MSRLNKLYEAMETLRKEGLPVDENLEKKANELEEEIIKKEILPVLSKTIEPALQPVKRELVLVVWCLHLFFSVVCCYKVLIFAL